MAVRYHSEETKKKISETLKRKYRNNELVCPWKGKKWDKERRKRQSIIVKNNIKKYGHSRGMLGKIPWNKGKPWSEKIRQKISESKSKNKKSVICLYCNQEFQVHQKSNRKFCRRECYLKYIKSNKMREATRKKLSISVKKSWESYSKGEREKRLRNILRGLLNTRPTSLEKTIIDTIKKYNLPYKYTGDGSFWIGRKNPDFININGEKICIEVYANWCHPKNYEEIRAKHFAKYGWKTIFINQDEIKNENLVVEKIKCVQ